MSMLPLLPRLGVPACPSWTLPAALALALASPAAAQDQTVKLGTLAPEGSPWHAIIRDMADAWKGAADGKIRFRIYPGGVAGDEPDMVRKMRIGQLHAAALTGIGLAEIAPEVRALQMPMLLQTDGELDYVVQRMAPKLEAILDQKGFKVLNWGEAGWVRFFSQSPVSHPDDLKPLKLLVWAGQTAEVEGWKDAGCRPVPLAATEIHTGLQSGLINAFATTPLAALSFQWFGSAKHMADLNWAPLVGATVITKKKWDDLPAAQQPALLRASQEAGTRMKQEVRKLGAEAVDVMKKRGLEVHAVPPAAAKEWEVRARASYPKLMGQLVPAEMVREVERLRDEYRQNVRK